MNNKGSKERGGKILLITFHFPPDIHPGAKRLGKFAKYLPSYGWHPVVLTKQMHHYTGVDYSLNKNVRSSVAVHRVSEWHLKNNHKRCSGTTKTSGKRPHKALGETRKGLLYRLAHYLDFPWLLPAFLQGLRLIRKENIDIILTSYPNQEAVVVGLLLKLVTGKTWVVDYRDLTRSFPLILWFTGHGNALRLASDKILDKIIVRKADAITVVGKRMREDIVDVFGPKIRTKTHVVFNGYDPDDFLLSEKGSQSEYSEITDGTFVITYLGSWTITDTPEYFLRGLGKLLRGKEYLRGKIRFIHIGEVRSNSRLMRQIPRWIQEENLNDIVDDLPHLPHSEALSYLKTSSAALLVQHEIKECPGATDHCLPTKGFEYLAARKPILALAPVKGEIAELIRNCNAGEVVPPTDVDAIEKAIYSMYKAHKNGMLDRDMDISVIQTFERKRQTGVLATILDDLLRKRS